MHIFEFWKPFKIYLDLNLKWILKIEFCAKTHQNRIFMLTWRFTAVYKWIERAYRNTRVFVKVIKWVEPNDFLYARLVILFAFVVRIHGVHRYVCYVVQVVLHGVIYDIWLDSLVYLAQIFHGFGVLATALLQRQVWLGAVAHITVTLDFRADLDGLRVLFSSFFFFKFLLNLLNLNVLANNWIILGV